VGFLGDRKNIGCCNSSDCNNGGCGGCGLYNSGYRNSGNRNSGICNIGDCNNGSSNIGKWNNGHINIGECNKGVCNRGSYNRGGGNNGDFNIGDFNSGDWNKCNYSSGCFNTGSTKIYMFNKPSEWTYEDWLDSSARKLMKKLGAQNLKCILFRDMTGAEKAEHPEAIITGGYLRPGDKSDAVSWWKGLSEEEKATIKAIPNFDRGIFMEITGIDVEED